MSVTVHLPTYLQPCAGGARIVPVEGSTAAECLADLVRRYPDMTGMLYSSQGRLHDYVSVSIGENFIFGDELSRPVKDGAQMHVLYILGGG